MKGLILSGGKFKRMHPLSDYTPKTMLQIQGRPLIEYVINGLVRAGISHIVVVIGEGEFFSPVIQFLQTKQFSNKRHLKFDIVTQREPGVRGAILAAEEEFKNENQFFLAHGDIIAIPEFYAHLKNTVQRTGADGGVAMTLKSSIVDFGVCELDATGHIARVIEHPGHEMDVGNYVGAGAYLFPTSFFKYLKQLNDFDKAINAMINEGYKIAGAIFSDHDAWMDIGTPYDLLTANKILFNQYSTSQIHVSANVSPKAHFVGPVFIEAGAVIEAGVVIKGPAYIGKKAYIGTNSLIRDHTVIEANCIIGYSVELKNSHLQPGTRVGRLSFVGDSVIGKNVEIRTGVTIMNHLKPSEPNFVVRGTDFGRKVGVIIGDKADIGANAVLEPKTIIKCNETIPHGSVVAAKDAQVSD